MPRLSSILLSISLCLLASLTGFTGDKQSSIDYDTEASIRISNFKMPDDIEAKLFVDASQTQNPGAICFDENGNLYIAELHRWRAGVEDIRNEQRLLFDDIAAVTNEDRVAMMQRDQLARPLSHYTEFEDRIVVVSDTDQDGRADRSEVWADGFNDPLDGPGIGLLSLGDGRLLYTNIPHLWELADSDGDGRADQRKSLQDGFGVRISFSGHDMHGLIQGPDGRIYWSIGDRGYTITTREGRHYSRPLEGAVFRCDPDGSNVEEFHRGLRNPQELAFDQYGNLFTCDNDADYWDTGRLVYVIEGGDSGWNHGHQALMNFKEQYGLRTPEYDHPGHQRIPMSPWMTEGIWDPDQVNRPEFALPAIDKVSWGPSGFVYNYGSTALPSRYAEHFWVCNFGGAKGDLETFTVKQQGAGFVVDKHETFMVGLGNTDVEFGPDGKMYLCCFNNNGWFKQDIGNVYTLFNRDRVESEEVALTRELLLSDFGEKEDTDLDRMMAFGDMRVRQRAQFELVERNQSELLIAAAKQTDHRLKRLHGVWGLGQLARKDPSLYRHHIDWLNDSDEEVRAQCARILSDSRLISSGEALALALDDPSARVRSFAAIGVGKCRIPQAIPRLLEILEENNNQDLFLRHGCVQGLWYLNEKEKILKLVNHESAAVRLGVVLALRKLEDPRIKYFLDDSDEKIRFAVIRAINDLDLWTARSELARHIEKYIDRENGYRLAEGHQDWIIQHRLINANFREGTAECARRLIDYAAARHLPSLMRMQALEALLEWPSPTVVDPTVGYHRALDQMQRDSISDTVRDHISEVFKSVDGELLAAAAKVALEHGARVPTGQLTTLITDTEATAEARIGALRGLAQQDSGALESLWDGLFEDSDPAVRAAASKTLLVINQGKGIRETLRMADSGNLRDLQAAFRNLAEIESPMVGRFFTRKISDLSKVKPGARLDLLESASLREEQAIREALERYNQGHAAAPLKAFDVCLQGGNAESGRIIFFTHAAGQCAKCHRINKDGGEAGPELTRIGSESDSRSILESIIDPNAVVSQGYGIALVKLVDGTSVGGTLMSQDESGITLKTVDPASGKEVEKVYPSSEIESVQPPMSAMPPMSALLTKSEIRDLVAYLSGLKGKKRKGQKGH